MCDEPHVLRDCAAVLVYAQTGRIIRHARYVLFLDRSLMRRHRVADILQTTIDDRYGSYFPRTQ